MAPLAIPLLIEVAEYLDALSGRRVRPDEATAGLAPIRARHPDHRVDLVWEEQGFDGTFQYDALVRRRGDAPGAGRTVSLGVCPDGELPWPLRGVQRWRDSDLVRVDGYTLKVVDAVAQMEIVWESPPMMARLVDACLVQQALAEDPVELTGDDVQAALDELRRRRGLLTAEDTRRWMRATGLTHAALEMAAERLALANRLRDRVTADRVDGWLAEHGAELDRIRLAELSARSSADLAPYVDAARRSPSALAELIRARLAVEPGDVRIAFETATARAWEARLGTSLARKEPGATLGPVETGAGLVLAQIVTREPAPLDAHGRAAARAALFDAWLAERRRRARIEWFWGSEPRTRAVSSDASAADEPLPAEPS